MFVRGIVCVADGCTYGDFGKRFDELNEDEPTAKFPEQIVTAVAGSCLITGAEATCLLASGALTAYKSGRLFCDLVVPNTIPTFFLTGPMYSETNPGRVISKGVCCTGFFRDIKLLQQTFVSPPGGNQEPLIELRTSEQNFIENGTS